MQPRRLPSGGRIDRTKPLSFVFNGVTYGACQGDTLASALLANGVNLIGRSIKYHRPRGVVGSGCEEPNAIVQVGNRSRSDPNVRATELEVYDGLVASSVNCWPNLRFDVMRINNRLARFMPAGFYYKTFLWPRHGWKTYRSFIRRAAGLGCAPTDVDPDRYDKAHSHCDVMVVGGGPSGMAAALEAGRRGAQVILADDQSQLGGALTSQRQFVQTAAIQQWVHDTVSEISTLSNVQVLVRTSVFGYYDHNMLGMLERVTDHLRSAPTSLPRQRLWKVRAQQVVIAAGAFERPLVFHNNDRPGVMLASAVSTYLNRYAVKPGDRAVVFTNNDNAYSTILDLLDAGVAVAAVIDLRENLSGEFPDQVRRLGVEVLDRHAILNVRGTTHVQAVEVASLDATDRLRPDSSRWLDCDLLAVSGGWTPALDMHCQSGGKAQYDASRACFVPGTPVQAQRSAGACAGAFQLRDCIEAGALAGANAAHSAGFGTAESTLESPTILHSPEQPIRATWLVPSRHAIGRGPKQFVDYQNDTSVADIAMAVRENFQSIEHVKRYTLLGFGTEQGKLGNVNGIGIVAKLLNREIDKVGTTTFRPAYSPVTFGALAGRDIGPLFDPARKTPMHDWNAEADAKFENVGQWKRAWYYPRRQESMHEAVNRECLATKNGVGILDYSTLGKIDVQGPDAGRFLDLMYTNDKSRLAVGRCNYGFLLTEEGMLLDDGVTARLGENHFFLTTTTGGAARVMAWLERWLQTEWPTLKVYLTSITDQWANISLNGPESRRLICELCDDIDFSRDAFPFMSFRDGTVAGAPARVFRVSFSGELAYEINIPATYGLAVWKALVSHGKKFDIIAYGTETMHVLRADKGYVIVGQDTDGSVTPVDLGMNWILSKSKEFIGKRSLKRPDLVRKDRKQLVGLLTDEPAEVIPEGAQIVCSDANISSAPVPMEGHVTSSYYSARVGRSIALALLKSGRSRMGETVAVPTLDGRVLRATVTRPIFYDPEGQLQNV